MGVDARIFSLSRTKALLHQWTAGHGPKQRWALFCNTWKQTMLMSYSFRFLTSSTVSSGDTSLYCWLRLDEQRPFSHTAIFRSEQSCPYAFRCLGLSSSSSLSYLFHRRFMWLVVECASFYDHRSLGLFFTESCRGEPTPRGGNACYEEASVSSRLLNQQCFNGSTTNNLFLD